MDELGAFMIGMAAGALMACAAIGISGNFHSDGVAQVRAEAISAGAGRYVVDPATGAKTWRWTNTLPR